MVEDLPSVSTLNKILSKIVADNVLNFSKLFLREDKTWHFMWIVCWADNSHEMTAYFLQKIKKK